jgi:hypothetical protein
VGIEGGGAGCFRLESTSLVQAAKVQALKPSTCMLRREAWQEEEPCWGG